MRKVWYLFVAGCLVLTGCGCENSKVNAVLESQMSVANEPSQEVNADEEKTVSGEVSSDIDVDLTILSSTMVYSEVYNMMIDPYSYVGKKVKMQGSFGVFEDPTNNYIYYSCVISDATACCSQGIEFTLEGEHQYPEDYPDIWDDITVEGEFELYYEGENMYCRLKDAVMY